MDLEIQYNTPIDCKIHVNNNLVVESLNSTIHKFIIDDKGGNIKIFITPFKIHPIVRINNIMVNYGLANITPWDHMLEFEYDCDFFTKYRNNIIASKMKHYNLNSTNDQEYDFYIGVGNTHNNSVNKIRSILKNE